MKATGIVRKLDELGRVVIPVEIRRGLDLQEKESIEIFVDGDHIILRKYQPNCVFCGDTATTTFKEKNICQSCQEAIATNRQS